MEYILEIVRNELKILSDELDNVDPETIVRDYLPIFDEMKILAYWEDKPVALFDYAHHMVRFGAMLFVAQMYLFIVPAQEVS